VIKSSGRSFPVDIKYVTELQDEPLWKQVRGALRQLLSEDDGDVLVFLPGSAEIRRCQEELKELCAQAGLQVLPLHGDLPFEEQKRAVAPRQGAGKRKVILSTNVAETSLTIEGVTAVIDSGLARVAGQRAWSGLPTLRVQPISQAQAAQRAGRAGRLRKGRCLRLYSKLDHDGRPQFLAPEICRLDLTEMVLTLLAADLKVEELSFVDPPKEAALLSAQRMLLRLGAMQPDPEGRLVLTPLGRRISELPLHPRLGRLILTGAESGVGEEAAIIAALLSERDLRLSRAGFGEDSGSARPAMTHGPSDVLHLLDLFDEAKAARFSRSALQRMGIDPDVAASVDRAGKQLQKAAARHFSTHSQVTPESRDTALLRALLCAYPDRVARRRTKAGKGTPEFTLAGGGSAILSPASVVGDAELCVLVDVEERGARTLVRLASAISADWLLDLPGNALHETTEPLWNPDAERVELVRRLQYEQLVLDESRVEGDGRDEAQNQLLFRQAMDPSLSVFPDGEEVPRFCAKLELVTEHISELRALLRSPPAQEESSPPPPIAEAVRKLCRGRHSLEELRALSILDALAEEFLAPQHVSKIKAELVRLTPDAVMLGRVRRVRIHYESGKPPWIASRLQDFFGMVQGPRVLSGRVAVVLHLLAPNQRAVQVTTDLSGFWSRHYPAIRKELCRRYPKHAWPEDPLA
jgi:ATP-dependent helicase HrpB